MNIALRDSGQKYNIAFGNAISINAFYYDFTNDGIFAKQIVEGSGITEAMKVSQNGVVYLKGVKQINAGFSKRFELTIGGNLIAKSFTTQL